MQSDIVPEKELRVLHLNTQAAEATVSHTELSLNICDLKATLTVMHFLPKGHTYFNNATLPNSATPYGPSIQTHESLKTIPTQTTITAKAHLWPLQSLTYHMYIHPHVPAYILNK